MTILEKISLIRSNIPPALTSHKYKIGLVEVELRCPNSSQFKFVQKILEPWLSTLSIDEDAVESWSIFTWVNSELVENIEALAKNSTSNNIEHVRRWNGDEEHRTLKTKHGSLVVHELPFKGITCYLPGEKTIFCVFDRSADISQCEHLVKYPARTQGRKYGAWDCHASCIKFDGSKAILLVGERRSGKTTCSLDMVSKGAEYISNDLCIVQNSPLHGLLVYPVPHMLRMTKENLELWPQFQERAITDVKSNKAYETGIVFYGGKYEAYLPVVEEYVDLNGVSPTKIGLIVFLNGKMDNVTRKLEHISAEETLTTLEKMIEIDRPLPDWMSISKPDHNKETSVNISSSTTTVEGQVFEFCFSDKGALEFLHDQLVNLP